MKIKLFIICTLSISSLLASQYKGCADTKQDALYTLSGNIKSNVSTYIEQSVIESSEKNVQSKISSYTHASSNLSLVNISYIKEGKEICAVVNKSDQIHNSKKLLEHALLYDEKNLPSDIDAKIETLSLWLKDIKQLSFLVPLFLEDTQEAQNILNKKEKKFQDLYDRAIAQSNSLFFKSCKSDKTEAKVALNNTLFTKKNFKEKKGFFDTISSIFDKNRDTEILDIFDAQIIYTKDDSKVCALLKKETLLDISRKMYADIVRVNEKNLSQNPKKRYKEIETLYKQIEITEALLKLFPSLFKEKHFKQLYVAKKLFVNIQKKTYPQYILFTLKGAQDISIQVDDTSIKNNTKLYIKHGKHSYLIKAKGVCPIKGTFENDLFEDETISEDLSEYKFPTVLFVSDYKLNIVIADQTIQSNVSTPIHTCNEKVIFIVKYAQQNRLGVIDSTPGATNTIVLNFLTEKELAVFNDSKTKNFTLLRGTKFSESLTPIASEQFKFKVLSEPEHGTLSLHKKGSFKYISNPNYVGRDSFEYEIITEDKTSAPKIVNILVEQSFVQKVIHPKKEKTKTKKKVKNGPSKESIINEAKYQKFKSWVNAQTLDAYTMKKIQERYPQMFQKLVDEKTNH